MTIMTRNVFFLTAAAVLATTTIANAQDDRTRLALELNGQFSIGFSDSDFAGLNNLRYGFLDVEGELAFDAANTVGIGFDLFGLSEFEGEPITRTDFYLYYNLAPGSQIQVGHAQPASELFIGDEALRFGGRNRNTLVLQTIGSDSFVRALSFSDDPALGLAYFGDYGQIEVAASAHFNQVGDGEVYSLAARYNATDAIALFAAVEMPSSDTATGVETAWWIGGSYSQNGFTGEIVHHENLQFQPDRASTLLTARYALPAVDGLTIGANLLRTESPTTATHFTRLAAEYELDNGFVIGGHVERQNNEMGTDVTFFGIEASFRF